MKTHKDLDVWKQAIDLSKYVYQLTQTYPKEEMFGLSAQMRRAVVSIASNIAEGAGRQSQREFVRFLYISVASANELDTQLEISKTVGIANEKRISDLQHALSKIVQMLYGLIRAIKTKTTNPDPQTPAPA